MPEEKTYTKKEVIEMIKKAYEEAKKKAEEEVYKIFYGRD